jgi:hypothetical protein
VAVTVCPDCRLDCRVRRGQLGRPVRCPCCGELFSARAAPVALRHLLHRSHPAGLALGAALLVMAAALAAWPLRACSLAGWDAGRALGGPAAALAPRLCLYGAAGGLLLGGWLVGRWRAARRER